MNRNDRPRCRSRYWLVASLVVAACTGPADARTNPPAQGVEATSSSGGLQPIPGVAPAFATDIARKTPSSGDGPGVAVIDDRGVFSPVDDSDLSNAWSKFLARLAPDGSTTVLTLHPHIVRGWGSTIVNWLSVPEGEALGDLTITGSSLETTATSLDGALIGLVSVADEPTPDAIAGARATSEIVIASLDDGVVYERTLEGNFVPEAFSRTVGADGVPSQVFLLEYLPADAPRFYRVRVLSTATGEVSLPLNLRNKVEQVDERMAGTTRSQVVAHEAGLLFTLYRGTIDGTPDGEPYAFVHTLDFADGVWCLDVDPALELERLNGTLVVGGDRLYVASANGNVGSFEIPSITDPSRSPSMDWVVRASFPQADAPVAIADDDGVWVAWDDGTNELRRIEAVGRVGNSVELPGPAPTAITRGADGAIHAIGAGWTTFGDLVRPDWLGDVRHLVVGD